MTTSQPAPKPSIWPGLALASAAALIALGTNLLLPTLSALLVAILLGMLFTNTVGVPAVAQPGMAIASKRLLRIGIVLLGLQLSLGDIAGLGVGAIGLVVAIVAGGFLTAEVLGRALHLRYAQRMLIGSGISICGAAAVAAVEGTVQDREDEDVVTAIALVVLFGTLMIPLVPAAGFALHLPEFTHALWAGASIHEVAQVVAAGGIISPAALKVAVIVKLARVLMLAPVILVLALVERRRGNTLEGGRRPPLVPLFVAGFLAAAVLRTTGVLPPEVLRVAGMAQTFLLAAAMFALGAGVKVSTLRQVGGRPLFLALATTVIVLLIGLVGAMLLGGR